MFQITEPQVSMRQPHPSLISHELQPKRSPDGMLETLLQQQNIRSTKAIILITPQSQLAVDVLPTKRRLEIERHNAVRRSYRLRKQEPHTDEPVQVSRT